MRLRQQTPSNRVILTPDARVLLQTRVELIW